MSDLDFDDPCEYDPPEPVRQTDPDARMAVYASEALDRMLDWVDWHADRAEQRDMSDGEGCAALYDLRDTIIALHRMVAGGAGGLLPSYVWFYKGQTYGADDLSDDAGPFVAACGAVSEGLQAALQEAEADCRNKEWESAETYQLRELETSDMRALWRVFRGIEEDRCFAKNGTYEMKDAQLSAAERLAFAPGAPMEANNG